MVDPDEILDEELDIFESDDRPDADSPYDGDFNGVQDDEAVDPDDGDNTVPDESETR